MCSTVSLVFLSNCVLIFWLQVSSSSAYNCTTTAQEQPIPGNANELAWLAKLDHLQSIVEMLFNSLTTLQEQSRKILAQQAACDSPPSAKQETSTDGQLLGTSPNPQESWASCKEAPVNSSGVYSIKVGDKGELLEAFCEQNSFQGGWLVIQYRFDGSMDFLRDWTDYRNGFGDIHQEFWIGLEWLHRLTSSRPYELMVEIKDFEGNYGYAHYSEFEIGSESEQYPLKKLGAYDGTAGDSLTYSAGRKFSTYDRDNDDDDTIHCAREHEGAGKTKLTSQKTAPPERGVVGFPRSKR
uniref:Fibrinogen C-terminal domain-containing protein n=1 Tax=Anopheles atroparvus TaxID=41427 RepID=A0A182J997_ANOAO